MKQAVVATFVLALIAFPLEAREPSGPVPKQSPGTWFRDEDYPTSERVKGARGITVFSLLVDPEGIVHDCRVDTSSGSVALDATACALLKARASFFPARDGKGKKIASVYQGKINWRLPANLPINLPAAKTLTVTVDIDKQGMVERCLTEKSADLVLPVDPCMQYPVGKKGNPFNGADGQPAAVRFVMRTTQEVQPR